MNENCLFLKKEKKVRSSVEGTGGAMDQSATRMSDALNISHVAQRSQESKFLCSRLSGRSMAEANPTSLLAC